MRYGKHLGLMQGGSSCAGRPRRQVVYVFDDNQVLRDLLVDVLRDDGFTSIVPFDSMAALVKMAAIRAPALIIADCWGDSQLTLAPALQAEIAAVGALAPTILLSGRAWLSAAAAKDLGVACVLQKPINLDELTLAIDRCLAT
jgi:two-component system nitrogen regulation response regulator NtrX